MKKLALTSLVIFTFCGLAYAGPEAFSGKDMKQVVPEPSCEITWTGFYIGAHAGYGFSDSDTEVFPLPNETLFLARGNVLEPAPEGVFGGVQVGYNHQFGAFVVGVEADLSAGDLDGSDDEPLIGTNGLVFPGGFIEAHQDTNWFGSFRGRLGFVPQCRLLLYATGGLAIGDIDYSANLSRLSQYPVSFSDTKIGWTAGAGAEIAITKRWSLKTEFLYYGFGDETIIGQPTPANPPFTVRYDFSTSFYTVNAGLNFHF
jgi:outer membrane immunogenic protein